jgi:ABC-type uncharacterized transport system involved in gliding motility auxiliary subunit
VINSELFGLAELGGIMGMALILYAVLLYPHIVPKALTGRSVKYGYHGVVMGLAFLAIVGLINFVSARNNWELDLTETGKFTLSEQTIAVLKSISEPVLVIGFFRTNDHRWRTAQTYLERYSRYSHHLSYEFHDPNSEPNLAESYHLKKFGLVFVSGVNRYETHAINEQSITTGLIRVTNYVAKTGKQETIAIPNHPPTNRDLYLTPLQAGFTFLTTLIVIPLLFVLAAAAVWWSRR